jgi:hypothetical protein
MLYSILIPKTMSLKFLTVYNLIAFFLLQNLTRIHLTNVKTKYNTENKGDMLSQIIFNTHNSKTNRFHQSDLNRNIGTFIQNLNISRAGSTCSSKLIHSSAQSKMRMLSSLISSCPGYCRLAISQGGLVDGARDFKLESKIKFL